ncbi:MAG: GxxExxY protein [Candidatus Omnitrophica bacterium]|nr:GxxExxY protein [Candidatus Omnitrophota bacterium]MCF7891561.1 GxxExxY protein [Candidatus Omnitrophota bacterium]MCF7895766.1 GxxExxY protein [Candidatus Omnitrophota bacterium]MCF7897327.1 GxxExxY protein [Candidatus Omnitrophota bacterium]MCF7909703.1 GxxExxY protein [Candidatus Omnitrophota bacterium]
MVQIARDNLDSLNKLTEKIIGLAIEVHKKIGPGFTEKIYQNALSLEFDQKDIQYEKEKLIQVEYKGQILGKQRLDFLIEDLLIIEMKVTEKIGNIHLAQILSYLKATGKKIGLILNFANTRLEIKRVIN